MAERSNSRSSSRRDTAQSPLKPTQRTTRTTRSQSHDIRDGEAGRPLSLRGPRSARGDSVESARSAGSRNPGGGRKTKQAARVMSARELPSVTENPSILLPSLPEEAQARPVTENGNGQQHARRDTRSPGGLSAISGTTARTSHSAQELEDLDPEEMLDALPELAKASDMITSFLAPEDMSQTSSTELLKALQDPTSRASKKLTRLRVALQIPKDIYGNESYINLSIAIRAIHRVRRSADVGNGKWRADIVLYKANVAVMLDSVLSHPSNSQSVQSHLDKLERDFPLPFCSRVVSSVEETNHIVGSSALSKETFQLALDLRTQYCITLLDRTHRQLFNPDTVVAQVFFEGPQTLKGWDVKGLQTEELSADHETLILERIKEIRESFAEDHTNLAAGQYVDLSRLRLAFPWVAFLMKLQRWSRLRLNEIELQMASVGGVPGISTAIEAKFHRAATPEGQDEQEFIESNSPKVHFDYNPAPEVSHSASDQVELPKKTPLAVAKSRVADTRFDSPASISHFKERVAAGQAVKTRPHPLVQNPLQIEVSNRGIAAAGPSARATPGRKARNPAVPATAPAKVTIEPGARSELEFLWDRPVGHRDTPEFDVDMAQQVENKQKKAAFENNKENIAQLVDHPARRTKTSTFIDPQPNAERIAWDTQESTQERSENRNLSRSQPGDELQDEQEEISQDEGFQQDTRSYLPRQRPAIGTNNLSAPVSTAHRGRKRIHAIEDSDESASPDFEAREAVLQANSPNGTMGPPLSQAENYRRVNSKAKSLTRKFVRKKTQSRNRWTEDEVNALMGYIEVHGISWALIKSLDNESGKHLKGRDQGALKDKARNMKFDYLKSGHELPQNFERISLNKMQEDKLLEHGVQFEAEEDEE